MSVNTPPTFSSRSSYLSPNLGSSPFGWEDLSNSPNALLTRDLLHEMSQPTPMSDGDIEKTPLSHTLKIPDNLSSILSGPSPKSSTLRELESVIEQLKKENFGLKLQLFYLQEQHRTLLKAKVTKDNTDIQDLLEENMNDRIELRKEIEDKTQLLMKSKHAIDMLTTENELLKNRFQHQYENGNDDRLRQLEQQCEYLSEENSNLRRQLRDNASSNTPLLTTLQRENNNFQEKIRKLEDQLIASEKEVSRLRENASQQTLQQQLKELDNSKRIQDLENQLAEKNAVLSETMEILDKLDFDNKRLRENEQLLKNQTLGANNIESGLRETVHRLTSKVDECNELLIKKTAELQSLREKAVETDQVIQDLRSLNTQLKHRNDETEQQVQSLQHQSEELLRQKNDQIAQLNHEIENIQTQHYRDAEEKIQHEKQLREQAERHVAEQESQNDQIVNDTIVFLRLFYDRLNSFDNSHPIIPEVKSSSNHGLNHLENMKEQLLRRLSIVEKAFTGIQLSVHELEEKTRKSFRDWNAKYDEKEQLLFQLEQSFKSYQHQHDHLSNMNTHLTTQLKLNENQMKDLQENLNSLMNEKNRMNERMKELEQSKEETRLLALEKNEKHQKEKELLLEEVRTLQDQEKESTAVIKKLTQQIQESDDQKQTLQEQLRTVDLQLQNLQQNNEINYGMRSDANVAEYIRVVKEKMARLSENNRVLILELEDKRKSQEELVKRHQAAIIEIKKLKIEISKYQQLEQKRQQRVDVDLSNEFLKQVEGTQQMIEQTHQALELEKKKYVQFVTRQKQLNSHRGTG